MKRMYDKWQTDSTGDQLRQTRRTIMIGSTVAYLTSAFVMAILILLPSTDLPIEWKKYIIIAYGIIGLLNIFFLLGGDIKIRNYMRERRRLKEFQKVINPLASGFEEIVERFTRKLMGHEKGTVIDVIKKLKSFAETQTKRLTGKENAEVLAVELQKQKFLHMFDIHALLRDTANLFCNEYERIIRKGIIIEDMDRFTRSFYDFNKILQKYDELWHSAYDTMQEMKKDWELPEDIKVSYNNFKVNLVNFIKDYEKLLDRVNKKFHLGLTITPYMEFPQDI